MQAWNRSNANYQPPVEPPRFAPIFLADQPQKVLSAPFCASGLSAFLRFPQTGPFCTIGEQPSLPYPIWFSKNLPSQFGLSDSCRCGVHFLDLVKICRLKLIESLGIIRENLLKSARNHHKKCVRIARNPPEKCAIWRSGTFLPDLI